MMSDKQMAGRGRAFAELIIRYRWIALALSVVVAVVAGSGVSKIAFDNDYRIFFSDENPQLVAFEKLQRRYTKIDNILFTVGPRHDGALTPEILSSIEKLTAQAWTLPYVLRVDALTNYQHTTAYDDDLVVRDLVEGAESLTEEAAAAAVEVALDQPALRGRLISDDGSYTGVNVTFQLPGESLDEGPEAVAAARQLEARIEADYPVDVRLTGMMMLNNAFFEASMRDMKTLLPAMYLIIIIVTFFLVRSFSATVGTIVVLMFSVVTAMGLAGWMGIKLTPPSSAAPTIIMTLAVADSIHILITLLAAMRRGSSKRASIIESVRQNLQPVILTSVTTTVGFLSLNFSDSPPFAHLGNITAMGVIGALFYSTVFLPAFLSIVPLRPKVSRRESRPGMGWLASFVTSRVRPILVGSVAVAAIMLAFLPANEFNDDFVGYFDEDTTFRKAVDYTTDNLTGVYQLQYSLDSGENNGVSDPEFLAKVAAFTAWLREQPEVRQVNSISDVFKRLNKNLHADDPAHYKLPETRELAAQYLLLYELSLPFGLDLNNQLNVDKSSTQVVAVVDNMSSRELREIAQRGERWLSENVELTATGIGPAVMFAYISDRNVQSMLGGTLIAVVIISGILAFALRNLRLGLLSLVPNLLPAAMAFGLWGVLRGEVNMAVSMVSGMTLGIVVDDTIHFLSKYLRGRREKNLSSREAVHYAFANVGRAIVVTTVILVAGFAVLAQSSFAMNSSMATLTAIAIVLAMIADFLLLPALLLATDRRRRPHEGPVDVPAVLESPAAA
jgi:predicted RND superfamily exporter protein